MANLEKPDKGRAWVVTFAACIINMILSGLFRISGIMYVAVIDEYNLTRAGATLPFTVRSSVTCLSGPVVGVLGEHFGIQTVTFFGGVMASTGAVLCCIAPNLIWLTVFWGGLHGLGFALATTLLQVVVNQHFQKYRATASGINLSGACVGSLGFPILIEWILDTYGLPGLFLLLGGIVMHVLPPSILLCPPQWVKYPKSYARLRSMKNSNDTLSETVLEVVTNMENEQDNTKKEELIDKKMDQISLNKLPMENMGMFNTSFSDSVFENKEKKSDVVTSQNDTLNPSIFFISKQTPNNEIDNTVKKEAKSPNASLNNKSVFQSLNKIVRIYLNPFYVLISICLAAYLLIFNPIVTVLVDYGKDKGFAELYGKYLINAMAIGDLVGRLCFGWVTDKKFMTVPHFISLMLFLEGIFIVLLPFASSISFFILLLVIYSITGGSILVLFPVLIHQYVDANAQSVAMACVKFVSGIISFGVPSMIGYFRDEVGSYDGMFYLTGFVSIVCGGLWIMEPVFVKFQHSSEDKTAVEANAEDMNKTFENDS